MAKLDKWRSDPAGPQGYGPLLSRQTNPGAVGESVAGLGESLFRTGAFLTREAKEAEEKTRALQRNTQVSAFTLSATQGYNKLKEQLRSESDPDRHVPLWEEFQQAQRGQLDAIGDEEVRDRAAAWLNQESALWDADVRTGLYELRIRQSEGHLKALTADAYDRRDDSQLAEYVGQMTADGFLAPQQAADYLTAARAQISKDLQKDAISGHALSLPNEQQIPYLDSLSRPQGLNDQEWTDFRAELMSKLTVDRAAAAQAERAREAQVHANEDKLWSAALGGTLDVRAVPGQIERQEISAEAGLAAVKMAAKGPVQENDPEAYMAMSDTVQGLYDGRVTRDKARAELVSVAAKLTPAAYQRFYDDLTGGFRTVQGKALADAGRDAAGQLVTVTQGALDWADLLQTPEEQKAKLAADRSRQVGLVAYHDQWMRDFLKGHPDASIDDIYVESRRIVAHLRQQTPEMQAFLAEHGSRLGLGPAEPSATPPVTPPSEIKNQPSQIPPGLESIWDRLDAEARASALRLLAKGVSPEQLLKAFEEQR